MTINTHIRALDHEVFRITAEASEHLAVNSYVIGGYVRDYLLGREAPQDIDFVTVGSGIALAEEVARRLPGKPKVKVFKNFGTAMITHKGLELEFVGARKESYDRS
ncbi:MAG: tRNA nucleotidyltransferase, partial [Eudoraea sp.]|nr:tRNA nucleotidyltransferase [Eudoraea sp.]